MLTYIVSVAGVSVLTVLLDIILPEGNMNKYIKSVFSVLVIIVVVSPVVRVIRSDIDYDALFRQDGREYQVDGNFILATNSAMLESSRLSAMRMLESNDYVFAGLDLIPESGDAKKISYVNIYIYSDSIKDKDKNIYIQNIQETVGKHFRIDKDNVRVILW